MDWKTTFLIFFIKFSLFQLNYCDEIDQRDSFETFLNLPEGLNSEEFASTTNEFNGRNAMVSNSLKWPNGIIPYTLSDKFTDEEAIRIQNALKIFGEFTCVKVIPKQSQHTSYVHYKKGNGCGTLVGYNKRKSKPHEVVFNDYCIKLPEAIQHETMHVMGIFHEQCRWDRDDYIEVIWKNVEPSQKKNFIKIPSSMADSYGIEYDYNSIMHYGATAFHKKGTNETMRIKQKDGLERSNIVMGQKGKLTKGDIIKINRMYDC